MTTFKICDIQRSTVDDVIKYTLQDERFGKNEVSSIHKVDKDILCLPTQTNCKMGCKFCHLTGTTRPSRNLASTWLSSAVNFWVEKEHLEDHSRDLLISFMGVGEPLINIAGVIGSIEALQTKYEGRIRFGISTMLPNPCALEHLTEWLAYKKEFRVKLHLSVHGIFNRGAIINSPLTAAESIHLVQDFQARTGRPIEFHYTLVDGINDSINELTAFSSLVRTSSKDVTIKFLTLSETNGCKATQLSHEEIRALFCENIVEFYDPPGRDVGASCGMFNRDLYNTTSKDEF